MMSSLSPDQLLDLYAKLGARYGTARSAEQLEQLSAARELILDQLAKWERLRTLAEAGQLAKRTHVHGAQCGRGEFRSRDFGMSSLRAAQGFPAVVPTSGDTLWSQFAK